VINEFSFTVELIIHFKDVWYHKTKTAGDS